MKLAILFSGGKDSTFTIYKALKDGHEVKYLISLISENPASYMFHYPNIGLTKVLADNMGIPIITKPTKGEKEKELEDIKSVLKGLGKEIDCVGAGALASRYQYDRVSNICKGFGLKTYTPCWMQDAEEHWKEILEAGFEVIVTGIAAEGLTKKWLGRKVGWKELEELKNIREKTGIHLGFEGGEGETLVLDCPLYRKRVEITESKIIMENECTGRLEIGKIQLRGK
ncbi:MAG: diphthine--ammonia ligase [Candidatus Aenigmarchaeota archaeon]|nr:diphthine--ammonia ligase [Candidatus Aenigmarchaeota archaeon]